MKLPLLLILLALPVLALAQTPAAADSVWQQFSVRRQGEYRYGYQDARGRVRIPARFGLFTGARRFRHIIAASEADTREQYYLLKNGRQVGRDSVYMNDYTVDCESEGTIIFQDRKRNRVGFFDGSGRVVIPARYNAVTPFHNGLALALLGARAVCLESGADTLHCEHPSWWGGRTVLLNASGDILLDSLQPRRLDHLNWYSLQLNAPAPDTATTVTFRARNGDRYTFLSYEKEFARWLYGVFLPAVRSGEAARVAPLCFSSLTAAGQPFRGWPRFSRAAFVRRFYQPVLRPRLSPVQPGTTTSFITSEIFNPLISDTPDFRPFLTDCGTHFAAKYPTFALIVSTPAPGHPSEWQQQHFMFIRTAAGYQLYSMAL